MRKINAILKIEGELTDKVWYNRCFLAVEEEIKNGETWLVEDTYAGQDYQHTVTKKTRESMQKNARKIEKKYRVENLGPYDDIEWGMILGKLSAIRWILGDDWDELDT